jgi:exosome complex component CSL4
MSTTLLLPGDVVEGEDIVGGYGTYIKDGQLRASIAGHIVVENVDDKRVVHVLSSSGQRSSESVIAVGDKVTAQVVRIGVNQANVEILGVGERVMREPARGIVRREDVRLSEVDSLIMRNCLRPGDIILAEVISLGDSRQYYLSTAAVELGVVLAKSELEGDETLLLPVSWKVQLN